MGVSENTIAQLCNKTPRLVVRLEACGDLTAPSRVVAVWASDEEVRGAAEAGRAFSR